MSDFTIANNGTFPFSEMAVYEARTGELYEPVSSLGATHQGDRVTLWFCGGLLLHISALDVLGEPRDNHTAHRLCGRARGECNQPTLVYSANLPQYLV